MMNRGPHRPLRRRRFLRGIGGVTLGLPFLESLAPKGAQAGGSAGVCRLGVFFCCNGVNMNHWFPAGNYGALTDAHLRRTTNEALIPFRDKLLFARGIHMAPRGFGRDPGGGDDHGRGMAHKLTAYPADLETALATGPSIDHVVAAEINPGSAGARRPPLNLMAGRRAGSAGLDFVSYSAGGRPVAAIHNPWNAFAEFINLGSEASPEARALLEQRRQSVLDLVREQFEELERESLSADDVRKLDAHFTTVRDIELQASATGLACADDDLQARAEAYRGADALAAEESHYPTVTDLQIDIMALAFACDFTRVATMQFDRGSGGPIFRWDGMSHEYNHHKLSHGKVRDDCFGRSTENGCDDVPGFEDMLIDIDRWHQGKFARLLERLDAVVEADGRTVLDNSLIMYTNEMSDGRAHSHMDLPYIFAGSAGGYLRQGQYVSLAEAGQHEDSVPHNRLLNTAVNAMGIDSGWFGLPEGQGGATMQGGVCEELLA